MKPIEPRIAPLVCALNETSLFRTFSSCEGHFGDKRDGFPREFAEVRCYLAQGVTENSEVHAFISGVLLDHIHSGSKWDAVLTIYKEFISRDGSPLDAIF